jgi:hypothetical protein
MSDRCDARPSVIMPDGTHFQPERLQLNANELIEGADLRDFVFMYPSTLPVSQLDPNYCPLIPIGTEINTDAGPIDCLFIAPSGLLTIVETKLWRNPEARREVVGQILDYAKEVSRWSYSDLDAKCQQKTGKCLWQLVFDGGFAPETNGEQAFIDQTSRALRDGRFLLLIVGDGIREDVERMAAYLQAAPQLLFTLHLIELQVFKCPDGGRLVVPQVVARTKEVVRAVVHVHIEDAKPIVNVDVPREVRSKLPTRDRMSEAEFLTQLEEQFLQDVPFVRRLLDDVTADERLRIDWHTTSFSVRAVDPSSGKPSFPLLYVDLNNKTNLWNLRDQVTKRGLPAALAEEYVSKTASILGVGVKSGCWSPAVPVHTLAANYDLIRKEMAKFVEDLAAHRSKVDVI